MGIGGIDNTSKKSTQTGRKRGTGAETTLNITAFLSLMDKINYLASKQARWGGSRQGSRDAGMLTNGPSVGVRVIEATPSSGGPTEKGPRSRGAGRKY